MWWCEFGDKWLKDGCEIGERWVRNGWIMSEGWEMGESSEFMGKTFQAAQLTHMSGGNIWRLSDILQHPVGIW